MERQDLHELLESFLLVYLVAAVLDVNVEVPTSMLKQNSKQKSSEFKNF